jgi:predicted dehydrogenase
VDRRVRVGVIGTGFGQQHIRAFNAHPRALVTAVCSTDAARATTVATEFGVPHAYGDHRVMLAQAPVDAVAVITPPAAHAPLGMAALDAGKHVLSAKPLAVTLADARALLERARASGLVHAIDQQLRFAWESVLTKELLDGGAIGRPLSLVNSFGLHLPTYYANPGASPNKSAWFGRREGGGGLFLANAPHEFDRLLWYFGPVKHVTGRAHTALPDVTLADGTVFACDADDSYHALLEFESGLVALARCTPIAWRPNGVQIRLEVHGEHGSLLQEGRGGRASVKLARASDQGYNEVPAPAHPTDRTVPANVSGPIFAIVDAFVQAILDGKPMAPSFEDGYRTQELIEAVVRSGRTGQRQTLPLV